MLSRCARLFTTLVGSPTVGVGMGLIFSPFHSWVSLLVLRHENHK